jgi:hypothetical protein
MKTVRTISGIKKIEAIDKEATMFRVSEILNEQRKALINRMLTDLNVYVDYRFRVKVDAQQLDHLREKLDTMKNYNVDMEKYGSILQNVLDHDATYMNAEPFYKDIDENIGSYLREMSLKPAN